QSRSTRASGRFLRLRHGSRMILLPPSRGHPGDLAHGSVAGDCPAVMDVELGPLAVAWAAALAAQACVTSALAYSGPSSAEATASVAAEYGGIRAPICAPIRAAPRATCQVQTCAPCRRVSPKARLFVRGALR